MERDEFLSKLGIGALALCMGCGIASCGKGGDASPSDGSTKPPASGTTFTVDLSSALTSVGASMVSNGVILVRIAAGNSASSFTAVQVACTHEGTAINFNTGANLFICPLHGSEFTTTGAVVQGPAARALQQYNVAVSGSALTVTA